MSNRIKNAVASPLVPDPNITILGIFPGGGSFTGEEVLENRTENDGPSGVRVHVIANIIVTPTFTVT